MVSQKWNYSHIALIMFIPIRISLSHCGIGKRFLFHFPDSQINLHQSLESKNRQRISYWYYLAELNIYNDIKYVMTLLGRRTKMEFKFNFNFADGNLISKLITNIGSCILEMSQSNYSDLHLSAVVKDRSRTYMPLSRENIWYRRT